ncbi:MAG: CpsD/CapB family tyrosine-protein kinase [Anaerolineales bacterium]|nr:CpsD/CapB family tyrosine-protein kinase [Anaerolineales bacterium]
MKEALITLKDPRSAAAEAFRTLRTNLIFAGLEQPLQTLLVTSPATEDGKTTTLANLAVVMAQGGRKTILVDCDLRRPQLHELFGLPAAPGFTDWITAGNDAAPLALAATGVDGLQLLPAGSPAAIPADLLTSRRLEALISTLKAQADFVLFDAPPLLAVSDAALLAANLDGVLLVVSTGQTRRDHAQRAKELLEKIRVRVVGAVLINATPEDGLGRY